VFLHWQSDDHVEDLGAIETRHCQACERLRKFKMLLQYRYSRISYLFTCVSHKQYFLVCEGCNNGLRLDGKTVEPSLEKNPIPLARRFGWILIWLVVAAMATGLIYSDSAQDINDPPAVPYYKVLTQRWSE
jgi:hypothetical protein